MGKWSNLKETMPRFVNPDDDFNTRVEKFKMGFADKPCDHGRVAVTQHWQHTDGKWYAEIEDGCVHETPIINSLSRADLARRRITADRMKDRLEEKIRGLNVAIEAYTRLILDRLENDGETSFKIEDGTNTYIQDDVYVSVKDKEALYKWVRENKLEDLFTINYQTLSSMIKTKVIDGEEIPPGVETFFKSKIAQRAPKGEPQDNGN